MLKRILIVLFVAAGIVIVPYFIGEHTEYLGEVKGGIFFTWLEGLLLFIIAAIILSAISLLYSIGCLIYDYIIGKK